MTAEQVFSVANFAALAGWLVLIVMGRHRWANRSVSGTILPLIFAVLYIGLIAAHWGETDGGFGSLEGVQALFSNEWLLLAGWVHYLAFDLIVGSWEVRDARENRIPHLAVIPSLIMTFLFGPAGFLTYMVTRTIALRRVTAPKLGNSA
ncbi:MAG TPA: ABA4-like family protein [Vicinamibacteria bacterium]|nr:ABA4-like family protein [Vicinamibacteria bacterium]